MFCTVDRSLFILAALLLPVDPAIAADVPPAVPDSNIRVERSAGAFVVELVVHAPVPPSQAWAVLTDFEHMAQFIPNLTTSQVLERNDLVLKVSQKGTARYGVFSADFDSIREIRLIAQREIRSRSIGGNIKRMESVMQLEAEEGGTRIYYRAEVQPAFWFPPLIGPKLVRHETAEQFSAIVQEMIRRR